MKDSIGVPQQCVFFCCCCYEILYTRTFFRFISTRMITNNVDRKTAFNCESIIPIRPFVLFSVALLTYLRFKQILQNPFVSMGGQIEVDINKHINVQPVQILVYAVKGQVAIFPLTGQLLHIPLAYCLSTAIILIQSASMTLQRLP